MQYFFLSVKTKNLILTLTDLNNHQIKKTKNIKNYIYYFHAPASTTKVYTETAFDNYDTILCNGDYQINEITQRETLGNLKKKNLIKTGYFYFDFLKEKINKQIKADEILVAPSWNFNQKDYINENIELLISKLIEKGFRVRFRPHPENIKRSQLYLNRIKNSVFWGINLSLMMIQKILRSMEKAKCLITDASGIAIEYVLMFKRPVLYLDDIDKVHNNKFMDFKDITTIDQTIKKTFGYSFKKNQINEIDSILSKATSEFRDKVIEIDSFLDNNFYNIGETKKKLNENIEIFL